MLLRTNLQQLLADNLRTVRTSEQLGWRMAAVCAVAWGCHMITSANELQSGSRLEWSSIMYSVWCMVYFVVFHYGREVNLSSFT